MTNEQFYTEVMSYAGMYPRFQLEKFYTYYTTKKPFNKQGKRFNIKSRLNNWFDKDKGAKRLDKYKKKVEKKIDNPELQQVANFLGIKARIIK